MPTHDPDRQRRLAEQLRANLRRRKAHARETVPALGTARDPEPPAR